MMADSLASGAVIRERSEFHSRENVMKRCMGAVLLIIWTAMTVQAGEEKAKPAEGPTPIRALLITGGCCHDYTVQKELIAKGLEERAYFDVMVVQQGGTATNSRIPLYENPDWAKGFDVVLHDECFSDVKDTNWTAGVLKPHKDGLPGVVIHCAMHCYRDGTDEWFKFCGVTSHRHGAHYPHEVTNRDAEHPIMKEFGKSWNNPAGELYWIEKVWPTAHPLAVSKNKEKGNDEVCVWTNEYHDKKTRIFGTTLGHHNETVQDPAYLDLLTRGTLWACNKLEPKYLKPRKPKTAATGRANRSTTAATSRPQPQPTPVESISLSTVSTSKTVVSSSRSTEPRIGSLTVEQVQASVLAASGTTAPATVSLGEQVYNRLQCNKCHSTQEGELLRGPHLPNFVRQAETDQIVDAILQPNKSIAQNFATQLFQLKSGKLLSGFVVAEDPSRLTVRDKDGKEFLIPVDEIEERTQQTFSSMPEKLADDLTVTELTALVRYLESLNGKPRS